jgi:hypothetical protein
VLSDAPLLELEDAVPSVELEVPGVVPVESADPVDEESSPGASARPPQPSTNINANAPPKRAHTTQSL